MIYIGWAGFLLYLIAQIGLALFRISASRYVFINCVASLSVAAYSIYIGSIQPFLISILWCLVSIIALARNLPGEEDGHLVVTWHQSVQRIVFLVVPLTTLLSLHPSISLPSLSSWLSLFVYSLAYLLFVFLSLHRRYFFLLCSLAAVLIIPELVVTGNYPTLALHVSWGLTSILGYFKHPITTDQNQAHPPRTHF
jgi:hypothetical protein